MPGGGPELASTGVWRVLDFATHRWPHARVLVVLIGLTPRPFVLTFAVTSLSPDLRGLPS